MAFLTVQTQWRYGPSGHRLGLDYAGCQAALVASAMDFEAVFEGLRTMEYAVLEAGIESDDYG